MKLLYCTECDDVVRLWHHERSCECGKTGGKYIDGLKAEIWGPGLPFGIDNMSFIDAGRNRPKEGLGSPFEAFVIPEHSPNVMVIEHEET